MLLTLENTEINGLTKIPNNIPHKEKVSRYIILGLYYFNLYLQVKIPFKFNQPSKLYSFNSFLFVVGAIVSGTFSQFSH